MDNSRELDTLGSGPPTWYPGTWHQPSSGENTVFVARDLFTTRKFSYRGTYKTSYLSCGYGRTLIQLSPLRRIHMKPTMFTMDDV